MKARSAAPTRMNQYSLTVTDQFPAISLRCISSESSAAKARLKSPSKTAHGRDGFLLRQCRVQVRPLDKLMDALIHRPRSAKGNNTAHHQAEYSDRYNGNRHWKRNGCDVQRRPPD